MDPDKEHWCKLETCQISSPWPPPQVYNIVSYGVGHRNLCITNPPGDSDTNCSLTTLSVCALSHFSRVRLFATPWTVARQAPVSTGFSRQEYWSGLPCSLQGDLPDPGMEPASLKSGALADGFLTTSATLGRPWRTLGQQNDPRQSPGLQVPPLHVTVTPESSSTVLSVSILN